MRLRARLTLAFLSVIALGAVSTLVIVRSTTEAVFRSYLFAGDAEKARAYASILGDWYGKTGSWAGVQAYIEGLPEAMYEGLARGLYGDSRDTLVAAFSLDTFGKLLSDRVALADSGGLVVADTAGRLLGTAHPPHHLEQGIPVMSDFRRVGTVLVGSMVDSSLTDVGARFIGSISSALLLATALSAALAFLLGLVLTQRLAARIGALNAAVGRVAGGDLGARVEIGGSDELGELAASFNQMTRELAGLEEAKRRIIADSAHELRTPVTLIQGAVEAMIDGIFPADRENLESLHEETVRLSRLIDMLRELELIDSGELVLDIAPLDPLEAARKAVGLFSHAARAKGLAISSGGEAVPGARADAHRLAEILHNLLSNAVKYTPEGGAIAVVVGRDGEGGAFRISVEDTGHGIPEAERARVFERFYRMDKSRARDRGGRGLGLAISLEIAKAHGGGIDIETSDLGGARFVLRLPSVANGP